MALSRSKEEVVGLDFVPDRISDRIVVGLEEGDRNGVATYQRVMLHTIDAYVFTMGVFLVKRCLCVCS